MSALNVVLVAGVLIEAVALVAEHFRHAKRSYVIALERQLAEIKDERKLLLDRLLHVTTGAPLVLPPQEPEKELTDNQKKGVRSAIDKLSQDTPYGGYPTLTALFSAIEGDTFQEDAKNNWPEGRDGTQAHREEVQPGAALQNDLDESDEEEEAVIARRKELYLKTASVVHEMKQGAVPVER